jgi:putative membrane protein
MEMEHMRITSLVAALGTVVLVACAKEGTNSSDTAKTADSAAAASATPTPAAPALTDANIAALLDEANMADSAAGKLASTKGTNADVKAFGVMMMNDHHALRKAGQDLVTKLGVTPTPPANDSLPAMAKTKAESMTAMAKGAAWDKAYIDNEVAVHQHVIGLIDAALGAAQNAELKDLLTKARPNIEAHLKRAQDIQSKLGAATTP